MSGVGVGAGDQVQDQVQDEGEGEGGDYGQPRFVMGGILEVLEGRA